MSLSDEQRKYERWWLFKKCRRQFSREAFRTVKKIKVHGPPSGFNAIVELFYDNGDRDLIGPPAKGGYKPNKSAVEVEAQCP